MPRATATVRAYNVGFGDSFLLFLPTNEGRKARVLIDCGSLSFGDTGQSNKGLVDRIIRDVTDADGIARIDLVIATHRHRDHISGFGRKEWRDVVVGEVWQPWSENPNDTVARKLFDAQLNLARTITEHKDRLAANPHISEASKELILAMAANALSNDEAIATLRTGFDGKPRRRYVSRERRPRTPPAVDGLPVHVLGPTRDPDLIAKLDPPSGQSYLALLPAVERAEEGAGADDRPFPELGKMTWREYGTYRGDDRNINTGQAKGQLRKLVEVGSLLSATTLDHALNNTSLMLMFEVGDQFLLFPGDSQWGTWRHALDSDWSLDLMRRTTFYKVGHHGSHNATPVRFVKEVMPENCWAVVSVAPYSRWKNVPKQVLLDEMEGKSPGRVITTMEPPEEAPAGMRIAQDGLSIDFDLPVRLA